jgi:hypothetical protein
MRRAADARPAPGDERADGGWSRATADTRAPPRRAHQPRCARACGAGRCSSQAPPPLRSRVGARPVVRPRPRRPMAPTSRGCTRIDSSSARASAPWKTATLPPRRARACGAGRCSSQAPPPLRSRVLHKQTQCGVNDASRQTTGLCAAGRARGSAGRPRASSKRLAPRAGRDADKARLRQLRQRIAARRVKSSGVGSGRRAPTCSTLVSLDLGKVWAGDRARGGRFGRLADGARLGVDGATQVQILRRAQPKSANVWDHGWGVRCGCALAGAAPWARTRARRSQTEGNTW